MQQKIGLVSLLVRNYDHAINWFTDKLQFRVVEDTDLGAGKRWVVVAPPGAMESGILLAQPVDAGQTACIGNQTGGRVFLFLNTDDFARDHAAMLAKGVTFLEAPRHETYGTVAVFADLYGNKWDLLELRAGIA
jgi:catechol 2,3-dioxygenase-like lactoylglutathione lyase family enzyme